MTERWRKPVIPVVVEHDTENYDIKADGHVARAIHYVYQPDDIERIRLGYACPNCGNPVETPKSVGLCDVCFEYDFGRRNEWFLENHRGGAHVGPATTLYDEVERVTEESARKHFNKDAHILVPRAKA